MIDEIKNFINRLRIRYYVKRNITFMALGNEHNHITDVVKMPPDLVEYIKHLENQNAFVGDVPCNEGERMLH